MGNTKIDFSKYIRQFIKENEAARIETEIREFGLYHLGMEFMCDYARIPYSKELIYTGV